MGFDDIVIIVPSLNPDEALVEVVKSIAEVGIKNIIVIDDGSDKMHKEPFVKSEKMGAKVLVHEINQGKGKALKTAFEYILNTYDNVTGVITVDGDNQHRIKDIIKCIDKHREMPEHMVLGCRDFSKPDVPPRSKFGNNLTNNVFRFTCGLKISDTQTGLRCIPYKYLNDMLLVEGNRYEYETNMLLSMKEFDIPYTEVEIETVYIEENASSHFNPIKDSIRIYKVIFKFLLSSIWASVVDIVIFALMCYILKGYFQKEVYILISTIGARVISSLCNYMINHKIVFRSTGKIKNTILKYYLLCICQMGVSYALVCSMSMLLNINGILLVLLKALIDTILFFISFRIQKMWVFKG